MDFFDTAGNVIYNRASSTPVDERLWKYDAAGRVSDWTETSYYAGDTHQQQGEVLTFDGDGRTVKRLKKRRFYANPPNAYAETPEYYIYSSVTGKILVELDGTGQAKKRNIYFNGTVIAENTPGFGVVFKHSDPVAGSEMQTESSGEITAYDVGRVERAALSVFIPTVPPEVNTPPYNYGKGGSVSNPESGATVDGVPRSYNDALELVRALSRYRY